MDLKGRRIGVVICNYNKSEYVKNCVASILAQDFKEKDIYVVDNASTDDSVKVLTECYGDEITILCNEENLGGAGGFDRGMEHCMGLGYSHILLVDNDTLFSADALGRMYQYLSEHDDVGMCGATVLQMDNRDYLQEMGGMIDFERYEIVPNYRGYSIHDASIPETADCDFLAACAVLVKREVIEKIGIMRRDYFVYWDDIEWCRRCKDAGYRLVALRDARIWHKWSANTITKYAFTEYYGRRNRLRYFATYINDADIDAYIDNSLRGMFNLFYGHYRKGAFDEMKMSLYALDDLIHCVWGKAPAYKTTVSQVATLPIERLLQAEKEVYLIPNPQMGDDGGGTAIERVIRFCNPKIEIHFVAEDEAPELQIKGALCVKPCPHVVRVKDDILPIVYMDRFLNCIITREDFEYFQNYENAYGLFYRLYEPLLREGVKRIRENDK